MISFSKNKELILAVFLAFFCAYDVISALVTAWGFTTDDAYISWVYARQLINGKGLLWPGSSVPVEGYSNFLWMLISALVIKLHLPLAATMKAISCFCLGVGLVFMYRLGRIFFSPLISMLPVFIFSHYYGVIWWTVSGLETMFYVSLSIMFIWQTILAFGYPNKTKPNTPSWVMSNIILLLLSLTRFEGLIWAAPLLVFSLCELKHNRLLESKLIYLWSSISLLCFILPYCVYFIWRLYYFGHLIPNSFICKVSIPGQFLVVDLDYIRVIIPLMVASLPYMIAKKECPHVLFWMPSLLYALMLWNADPVIAHLLRLFMAPFALFSFLPVFGVKEFVEYFKINEWNSKLITSLVILLITFVFIPGNNVNNLRTLVTHYQERIENRENISAILNTQATKGASVLVGDCGVIPFNTREDIRIIDSQCLNNYELAYPYRDNLDSYVNYLETLLKPEWVIANYYPFDSHWDTLSDRLYKKDFFKNYQLVATFESGLKMESDHKVIDYVYKVYKRRSF